MWSSFYTKQSIFSLVLVVILLTSRCSQSEAGQRRGQGRRGAGCAAPAAAAGAAPLSSGQPLLFQVNDIMKRIISLPDDSTGGTCVGRFTLPLKKLVFLLRSKYRQCIKFWSRFFMNVYFFLTDKCVNLLMCYIRCRISIQIFVYHLYRHSVY